MSINEEIVCQNGLFDESATALLTFQKHSDEISLAIQPCVQGKLHVAGTPFST